MGAKEKAYGALGAMSSSCKIGSADDELDGVIGKLSGLVSYPVWYAIRSGMLSGIVLQQKGVS